MNTDITIVRNGLEIRVSSERLLSEHIQGWSIELTLEEGCFAVALNGEFIPRHRYGETRLMAGDALELVTPMMGG